MNVRQPAVAGMFYPDDPTRLRETVGAFLSQAPRGEPDPCAMVSPHAGYVYSGYTAACGYRNLPEAPADAPRRVILLGPSHRVYLDGASVGNYDAWRTPLGDVSVDRGAVALLAEEMDVSDSPAPHRQEHSMEVQLPFLQETVKNFTLIPLVFGDIAPARLQTLIMRAYKPGDLIVVSSDLSHYHPYETAREIDGASHEAMLALDPDRMAGRQACGARGMAAVLGAAREKGWSVTMGDYRTSGDTAGDKSKVVGYATYLFYDG